MNILDSRFLSPGDTYAQRFTHSGTYHYTVGIQGSLAQPGHDAPFAILVGAAEGDPQETHYVAVTYANSSFSASPDRLEIRKGDVVLWSAATAGAPGFAVSGQGEQGRFDSAAIHANGMYSHAFGVTGVIEWSDPHQSGVQGTIVVEAHPRCRTPDDRQAYAQMLGKGTVVTIEDGRAYPDRVKVTVGQTVFFAVKSGRDISIVEKTLLGAFLNPQPLPPGRR